MSPVNESPTPLMSAARSEAAYTVNNVTTATPIASAVAAAAVRRGLRWALRRARVPVTPRHAARGRPRAPVTGRAMAGPRRTTPVVVARAPSPTAVSTPLPEPRRPATMVASPAASTVAPATVRSRDEAGGSAAEPRSASSGATRHVRTAGITLTATVRTIPAASEISTLRAVTTRPAAGSANPKLSNRPLSSPAIASPPRSPRADPAAPTARASASTPVKTWRRVAPTARSSEDSLARCAARMQNVLAMEKPATSSAIPAKMTRKIRSEDRNPEFRSLRFCWVSSAPLTACTPSGSTRASRPTTTAGLTPRAALTSIAETPPGRLVR